jgi:hypothetical protein
MCVGVPIGWVDHPKVYSDPTAPPEVLLSHANMANQGKLTKTQARALAANPGVPLNGLFILAIPWPAEVTRNPAFLLGLATDSSLLDNAPYRVLRAIAACPDVEPGLVRRIAADRAQSIIIRAAAAGNPSCPPDLLRDFPRHAWKVREALAGNPALPEDLVRLLAVDRNRHIRQVIADLSELPKGTLEVLVNDPDWHVRAVVAQRESLPAPMRKQLAGDVYYQVRAWAAIRRDLAPEILAEMALKEQGVTVLTAVRSNPRTPRDSIARPAPRAATQKTQEER